MANRSLVRTLIAPAILVVVAVVGCAVVAAAAAASRPVVYTASTDVLYGLDSTDQITQSSLSDAAAARLLAAQPSVITGDAVMKPAATALKVTEKTLIDATSVTTLADSNALTISVTGPTPVAAASRAQEIAKDYAAADRVNARRSLSDQASALDDPIKNARIQVAGAIRTSRFNNATALQSTLTSLVQQQFQLEAAAKAEQGNVEVLTAATAPTSASSLSSKTAAVLGAAIGLVLAVGLLFLLDWWRRREPAPVRG